MFIKNEVLHFSWKDTLRATGILILTTIVSYILKSQNRGDQSIIMVYILSVMIVATITTGYFYGLAASVLSVLLFNFLFTVPYYTFMAIQTGYPITFLTMLIVSLVTSSLTTRIRNQADKQRKILFESVKEIWGPFLNENKTLRVNIANIRRKIEATPADPCYILTEVGVGYRMAEDITYI